MSVDHDIYFHITRIMLPIEKSFNKSFIRVPPWCDAVKYCSVACKNRRVQYKIKFETLKRLK